MEEFLETWIHNSETRRLVAWRATKGELENSAILKEDRSRDLDFVSSGGFYFDREEEQQHTGAAGF